MLLRDSLKGSGATIILSIAMVLAVGLVGSPFVGPGDSGAGMDASEQAEGLGESSVHDGDGPTLETSSLETEPPEDNKTRLDERIVAPHGTPVMAHIPVIAGYEPVPVPQHCEAGQPLTGVFYSEGFEGGHGYTFQETPLAPHRPEADPPQPTPNLWNVTSFEGYGPDGGHSQPNRLYFGHINGPHEGSVSGVNHTAGTAKGPSVTLPSSDQVYLSFATKWHVEWLRGYDHLWVEAESDGEVHLLCTANAHVRGDPTSSGDTHGVGSCSPLDQGIPCPPLEDSPAQTPSKWPAWETRIVEVPPYLLGETIQLRFTFDSADEVANDFMGWMVDDVQLGTGLEDRLGTGPEDV